MGKGDSVTVFIVEGVAGMRLVIPRKGATAEETRVFAAARKALGAKVVEFKPQPREVRRGQVAVSDPVVIKAVRLLSKRRKEKYRIHEDLQLLKVRCPYCDFTTDTNTPADQQALADHIAFNCEGQREAEDDDTEDTEEKGKD